MKLENEKNKNTFVCAIDGIKSAIKTERNLKIHCIITIIVIIAGLIFKISPLEWCICLLCIGLVISAELINTAIETTVDMYTREKNELAGRAKDIAAGAVFIMSIFPAIIGIIIFLPKFIFAIVY